MPPTVDLYHYVGALKQIKIIRRSVGELYYLLKSLLLADLTDEMSYQKSNVPKIRTHRVQFKVQNFLEVYILKKSTRILAILMAFAMLLGSFSVMGSAYQAYKGDAIKEQYNDVDKVDFTLEQYASMGLDEVDRMLAKEQLVLDVFIGTLDLASIDTALKSVSELVSSVSALLPMLGDAQDLPTFITPIQGVSRAKNTDLEVIYALLDFIANIAPLGEKYVNGSINLGMLDGFIRDFVFDVRYLAIGLIYGMTAEGKAANYDAIDDGKGGLPEKYKNETNGAITLLQTLLNELVLGEWKLLDDEFDDPYSVVMPESYGLKAIDTKANDYYGWRHPKDWVTVGLGGVKVVTQGAAAPAADYSVIDITTDTIGYDFIEKLMQTAYNNILIPVLDRDTRPWLRELCGVVYDETYSRRTVYGDDPSTPEVEDVWYNNPNYDPNYDGDFDAEANKDNPYLKVFNVNATVETVTIPEGQTFVDNFNNTLGDFLDRVLAVPRNTANADGYKWQWTDGGNDVLFDNICSAGKFIVAASGNLFFGEHVTVPPSAEVAAMSNQQLVAFILKAILNSSVDWMYIEDEYETVADVGYRAIEQLAWQDIPQFTYTKPERSDFATAELYYDAVVDKALDILFDVAIYNLNQGFDMVPAKGNNPAAGAGLLQYGGDTGNYENNLIQIVAWAVSTYGAILNIDFRCDADNGGVNGLTIDDVWMDLDSIINSLIPIKGKGAWISDKIAGDGTTIVSKPFIFDYIVKPIVYLDATNLAEIFARNPEGAFMTDNGVDIIMNILNNVFELLFPGVFQKKDTVDELLVNTTLGAMVGDLVKVLGTKDTTNASGQPLTAKGPAIAEVALPLVCMILGLSDDQEFEEAEVYLAETIPSSQAQAAAPTFTIFNGSSGINTAFKAADNSFTQDKLYTYKIKAIFVSTYDASGNNTNALNAAVTAGTEIAGGDSIDVTLNGTRTAGNLVEVKVEYEVYGETGAPLVDDGNGKAVALSKTVYSYVGETNKDDDEIESVLEINKDAGSSLKYYPTIYLDGGDGLDDIESYGIRVQDKKDENAATASVSSVSNVSTVYPFAAKSDDAKATSVALEGKGGLYFLNPFKVANKTADTLYERYEDIYAVDENGNVIIDEETGEPADIVGNNEGVIDGKYVVNTVVNAFGSNYTVSTNIVLYDDYGLDGLFNRAVQANRQRSDYNSNADGAWNRYVAALTNAARLVLKPKTGSSFYSEITTGVADGYATKYEELADKLEIALEDLEEYANNLGTAGLKDALKEFSGVDYVIKTDGNGYPYKDYIEYDDPAYKYFGMRDYVPHTYNKYRDARDRVWDLINSQEAFVNAPNEDGSEFTTDQKAAYDASVKAYNERVENMGVIGSIEATYALHMLDLTGKRLIRLSGDTSKLQYLYTTYSDAKEADVSYTVKSEDAYDRAVAFAAKVLAESDPLPSKINRASAELVEAWKDLAVSASYAPVDAAIKTAKTVIDVTGTDANKQKGYTVESYQAFIDAYNAALDIEKDLSDTDDNNLYIQGIADALTKAYSELKVVSVAEPVFEFTTDAVYNDFGWNGFFVPQLYMGQSDYCSWGMQYLKDGTTPVDAYIVGYGEGVVDEATALMMFSNLENVDVVITPSSDDGAGTVAYGTGSTVEIFNASNNERLATYVIIVYGDLNGDGTADANDAAPLNGNSCGLTDWLYGDDSLEQYYAVAADLNGDGNGDGFDMPTLNAACYGLGYINQVPEDNVESFIEF